jgi:hypothetical protein
MVFLTCGYLKKLASKPSLLGGRWGSRFFAVEERLARGGGMDLYFTYYPDKATASKSIAAAGDAVLLSDLMHVSCMRSSGRLALYTSAASTMPSACKEELRTCAALVLEVETPSRPYFLLAATELELLTWAATLQRLAALKVDPIYFGQLPEVPPSVVQQRRIDGSLCPEVALEMGQPINIPMTHVIKSPSRVLSSSAADASGENSGDGGSGGSQNDTNNTTAAVVVESQPVRARAISLPSGSSGGGSGSSSGSGSGSGGGSMRTPRKMVGEHLSARRNAMPEVSAPLPEPLPAPARLKMANIPPPRTPATPPPPSNSAWGDEVPSFKPRQSPKSAAVGGGPSSFYVSSLPAPLSVQSELVLELSTGDTGEEEPTTHIRHDTLLRERLSEPVSMNARAAVTTQDSIESALATGATSSTSTLTTSGSGSGHGAKAEITGGLSLSKKSNDCRTTTNTNTTTGSVLEDDSDEEVNYAGITATRRHALPIITGPKSKVASVVDELLCAPTVMPVIMAVAPVVVVEAVALAPAPAVKVGGGFSRPRTAHGRSSGHDQTVDAIAIVASSSIGAGGVAAAPSVTPSGPASWMGGGGEGGGEEGLVDLSRMLLSILRDKSPLDYFLFLQILLYLASIFYRLYIAHLIP